METYQIPPDLCLVVRAFAGSKSLREAAKLLNCDPAVLVRKAQRIEADFSLLQKIRGRWALTESGRRVVQWVEQSVVEQKSLLNAKPRLRIATTTWLAEQALIPTFNQFNLATENRFNWVLQTACSDFENNLLSGQSDYIIVCHPPKDPAISHRRAMPERWIAVVPSAWKKSVKNLSTQELIKFLSDKSFIRHAAINHANAVGSWVEGAQETQLMVDTLIGVRAAVASGIGWSCLPEMAVRSLLRDQQLLEISLPVHLAGHLCIWWLRSRKDIEKNVAHLANWLCEK